MGGRQQLPIRIIKERPYHMALLERAYYHTLTLGQVINPAIYLSRASGVNLRSRSPRPTVK